MDVAVDPPQLLQIPLVPFTMTMLNDEVPPGILIFFTRWRGSSNGLSLLGAEGEVAELVAAQLLQHVLETPTGFVFVVGAP